VADEQAFKYEGPLVTCSQSHCFN